MLELRTELLYEMHAGLETPIDLGQTPEAARAVVYVTGGWIKGPKLNGKLLPGGGDWLRIRGDGSMALDVRACFETDDGAIVYMTYPGRIVASPDLLPRILDFHNPETVDPASYYFRTQPLYETSHPKYAWLNHVVAVGVGKTGNGGVQYSVYRVL